MFRGPVYSRIAIIIISDIVASIKEVRVTL